MSYVRFHMDELTVEIFGDIGGWGFYLEDLINQTRGFKGSKIKVPINSYGGEVFEGIAVYNVLRGLDATIETSIVGYAMSMGTVIAMAGDHVTMPENGYFMIHEPWAVTGGEATDMETMGQLLDTMGNDIAEIYAKKTGLPKSQIRKWMKAEKWMNSKEAKRWGFIDEITPGAQINNSFEIENSKLQNLRNMPKHNKSAEGAEETTEPQNGTSLARVLNDAIDEMVTDDMTRADIISDMADAADVETGTVNQILDGDIDCPPFETRIEPFANVLGLSVESLRDAGLADGCPYEVEADDKVEAMKNKLGAVKVVAEHVTEETEEEAETEIEESTEDENTDDNTTTEETETSTEEDETDDSDTTDTDNETGDEEDDANYERIVNKMKTTNSLNDKMFDLFANHIKSQNERISKIESTLGEKDEVIKDQAEKITEMTKALNLMKSLPSGGAANEMDDTGITKSAKPKSGARVKIKVDPKMNWKVGKQLQN